MRSVAKGALVWLVPFLLGAALVDPSGTTRIPSSLFFMLMLLITAGCAAWVVRRKASVSDAAAILLVPIVLDQLILLPLTKMPQSRFWLEVAPVYLIACGIALVGARRKEAAI